jgi:uncharacterized protein
MDWVDYAFILAAYVVASAIKGLTGIGFSTSCLPIMALRLDLRIAIPLVIIPSIVSNLAVMVQAGCFREAFRRFWPLYLASLPGLLAGLAVLVAIDVDAARAILGLVLVVYALWALANQPLALTAAWRCCRWKRSSTARPLPPGCGRTSQPTWRNSRLPESLQDWR